MKTIKKYIITCTRSSGRRVWRVVRGSGIRCRMRVGVDRMRGSRLAWHTWRRGHRMIVQRIRWWVMEHVRIRAGRVMVVMMVMAAAHHTRHGTEKGNRKKPMTWEIRRRTFLIIIILGFREIYSNYRKTKQDLLVIVMAVIETVQKMDFTQNIYHIRCLKRRNLFNKKCFVFSNKLRVANWKWKLLSAH